MAKQDGAGTRAYQFIKQQLLDGHLEEGTFLTEAALATEVGVSRTPIREALQRLDVEKLVTLVPGRGAFIPHVTVRSVYELMQARELIEVHSIREISMPDPGLGTELRDILKKQAKTRQEPVEFIEQDRTFHQLIVNAAGNIVLSELYSSLRDRQTLLGVRAVKSAQSRVDEVEREHAEIVDAVEAGEREAAIVAVRTHLKTSTDVLMTGLAS